MSGHKKARSLERAEHRKINGSLFCTSMRTSIWHVIISHACLAEISAVYFQGFQKSAEYICKLPATLTRTFPRLLPGSSEEVDSSVKRIRRSFHLPGPSRWTPPLNSLKNRWNSIKFPTSHSREKQNTSANRMQHPHERLVRRLLHDSSEEVGSAVKRIRRSSVLLMPSR